MQNLARVLRQVGDEYTAAIDIAPQFQDTTNDEVRAVTFVMPPETEVEDVAPSTVGSFKDNVATFTISKDTKFPYYLTITSGPSEKTVTQLFVENFTSPDRILVMAGVGTLLVSGFQGASMLRRRKAYGRTAKLIAKIYENKRRDQKALSSELITIHDSLYRMFVEDKMTDEQFEKLHTLVHEHLPETEKES